MIYYIAGMNEYTLMVLILNLIINLLLRWD
jgi:hypothetical protein